MALPVIDRQEAVAALDDSATRFLDLLRAVPDPTRPAIGVWNIADVATHVSHQCRVYPAIIRGEGSPVEDQTTVARQWQRRVAGDPERDLGVLIERIELGVKDFKDAIAAQDWNATVPWHGGHASPVWALPGVPVLEFEVHGRDIAEASGLPWRIDPDHARLAITAHFPWLKYFVDPQKASSLQVDAELRVRGGPTVFMELRGPHLEVRSEPSPRVDVHISADAVAYLLAGYGRISQVGAALTGKIVAWGRKPWLALRLGKIFYSV